MATDITAHRAVLSEETAILAAPEADALASGNLLALQDVKHARKIAMAAQAVTKSGGHISLQDTIAKDILAILGVCFQNAKNDILFT